MSNQKFHGKSRTYTIGKELGKGGEGQVYDLTDDPLSVLKVYSEPLNAAKIRKLQLMTSLGNDKITAYAAWPQDVVKDSSGVVRGFVMKRLNNYVPIHMLFSPMDRKKIFPDKGYNFLVRVAGNLSKAFHACHASGIVMGDVNEGNILVNSQGMVAFIDCDSFQLKDGNGYFFCEVGVPRYTPPEILVMASFENLTRTVNTDNFSLAVILFQLLFLGRHPFAGKNSSTEEIDEEKAIKQKWFAYSLNNQTKKLSTPDNTYSIHNITSELSALFHSAFEQTENRPQPTAWAKEIESYERQLVSCAKSKIHFYPSKLKTCVWCEFKEKRNIVFFLDDSYLQHIPSVSNIESFINGFKIEPLDHTPIKFPNSPQKSIIASSISPTLLKNKNNQNYISIALLIASLALAISFHWGFIVAGILGVTFMQSILPWRQEFSTELKRRNAEYLLYKQKLELAIAEYNNISQHITYRNIGVQLEKPIIAYKNLPAELIKRRKIVEEKLYNDQLHQFLVSFWISNHSIPSIGPTRKTALSLANIKTASDITKLNKVKVQGIGPTVIQVLFSWQRQVSSNFIYQPNNYLIANETRVVGEEIERKKKSLEHDIKREYQSLQYLKVNIEEKQKRLQNQIEVLKDQYFQAKADLSILEKIKI